jgi:flagellar hook-basal body complex protein FliE
MISGINGFAKAVEAYSRAASGEAAAGEEAARPSFAALVKDALEQTRDIGRQSEALSTQALINGADVSQVVTAVAEAEVAVQTVVAVRDKVVEAYKDIMRMPI